MPAESTHQVAWPTLNVTVGEEQKQFKRDDLLPPAASQAEAAERNILLIGGALRPVEVYYEPGEKDAPPVKEPEPAAPAPAPHAPVKAAAAPVIVGAEDDTPVKPAIPSRPATGRKT